MSLVGKRAEIAAALTTVTDVTGFAYRPTTPKPGDAWPQVGPLERAEGYGFLVTWRVLVFLPQNEQAASTWLDKHFADLFDALEPVAFVDRAEPVTLSSNVGEQFALQFTVRSED